MSKNSYVEVNEPEMSITTQGSTLMFYFTWSKIYLLKLNISFPWRYLARSYKNRDYLKLFVIFNLDYSVYNMSENSFKCSLQFFSL